MEKSDISQDPIPTHLYLHFAEQRKQSVPRETPENIRKAFYEGIEVGKDVFMEIGRLLGRGVAEADDKIIFQRRRLLKSGLPDASEDYNFWHRCGCEYGMTRCIEEANAIEERREQANAVKELHDRLVDAGAEPIWNTRTQCYAVPWWWED